MAQAPNTGSTLSLPNGINKTSTGLSTHMLIMVNNTAVGAIQNLQINENRTIEMVDEVGTDGHIDSCPTRSTDISGSCTRIRFDRLRIAEAFSRGFVHVSAQVYPFDIVIIDKQKRDQGNQISTVIKNVWIESISYAYGSDNWIITDTMNWKAETIYSILNAGSNSNTNGGAYVARGGELGVQFAPMTMGGIAGIEQAVDTGMRRGGLDASGLIDLAIGNNDIF